ncbi:sigma 54-interacting transcriptional regulator [Pontibacterium granulatum]|uniref:sigma-54 interaction domain-containing protein n=1 Tax=Pontibacterium granulatum TaxID=2036029 RepID=UPI00249A691D|nr:sigma 54-interacting transcriptional regulator [Pontibacterium granulatum]MDI3326561.1 sigma 54-interacting transcriptional regulator [Pontibacterium granulatum]
MRWDEIGQQDIKQQALAFFTESFEQFYEHAIAVDIKGTVTWISEAYYNFLELDESPIGNHITDIVPNSYLPGVIASGEPIFLNLLFIKEQWIVISAIPLQDERGKVVGGFGFVASESVGHIKPLLTKYNQLQNQLRDARNKLALERSSRYRLSQIVGRSDALQAVKKQVRQAARFDISVLLTGETGTGKELFAHALHDLSSRSAGPFVSINVAAIPENLIEAEFFGVAPGAYTGAAKEGRVGKFELADGGTLFLDEIGDMPVDLQAKLLRALQEKEFEAVGSNTLKKVDVRIIAATSRNLMERVESGHFRADLYYRLSSLPIHLPPLRDRLTDIEALGERFVDEVSAQLELPAKELTPDALQLLCRQSWPGNVRELHNVIERACVLSDAPEIDAECLRPLLSNSVPSVKSMEPLMEEPSFRPQHRPRPLADAILDAERAAIMEALAYTRGRKTEAAKLLGISRANLYDKLKKVGL